MAHLEQPTLRFRHATHLVGLRALGLPGVGTMYAAQAVTSNLLKRWMESQGDLSNNERRASSESLGGVWVWRAAISLGRGVWRGARVHKRQSNLLLLEHAFHIDSKRRLETLSTAPHAAAGTDECM